MQVIKTREGIKYREKIYIDGKAMHSPRFDRKTDATNWKVRMLSGRAQYQSTGNLPEFLKDDEKITLSEYATQWLETRVKLQLSKRTHEHYSSLLRLHILPLFGKIPLKEIKITHGDQLIQTLALKEYTPKGINLVIGAFKRVLIEATKEERIVKNPLQYFKDLKEPPRTDAFLTVKEINTILEISQGTPFYSLFILAVNTGMRRGELAGLCWDKVNFDINMIEVSRLRDRYGLSDRTKTACSRRYIPMNTVVRGHLWELHQRLKAGTGSSPVLLEGDGTPFDVHHTYRDFHAVLRKAEVTRPFRFHDLRHTFASHFMMNGGNIYDLQKILGHTSLDMTQRYAHLSPAHLVQAANVVSFGSHHQKRDLKISALIAPDG